MTAEDGIVVDANDDGGGRRNSRLRRYLTPGLYIVETTTYREPGLQPLSSDFELVIHLMDEEAERETFNLKIETIHVPDQLIAGEPFTIHYRAGNVGGGDLADAGGYAVLYAVAPGASDRTPAIYGSAERWQAGVSYHTGSETTTATSVAIDEAQPFSITLNGPGSSWVFTAAIVFDQEDEEIGFHGIWRDLEVLSSATFGPVTVSVSGAAYEVSATADAEGLVTTLVASVTDAEAEVDPVSQAKATYAAAVRTEVLDGIFERAATAGLPVTAEPAPIALANPSSTTLLKALAGLTDALAAGEAINPIAAEDLTLGSAETAAARYATVAASWSALQERVSGGDLVSFAEAFALQSELAYAERVIAPAVTAGEVVGAARAAELGWQDPAVQTMADGLAAQASCASRATALRAGLEAIGAEDVDALIALDRELRAARPIHGLAVDQALCAAGSVDRENSRFLRRFDLAGSEELGELFAPDPPAVTETAPEPETAPAPPEPHQLRIIARLADDGWVEHGVELASGERILPPVRYLSTDVPVDGWRISSDVRVDGTAIGKILARRLADGRVEMGFQDASGVAVTPEIRFLPADLPVGVWFRSGGIEVAPQPE